MPHRPRLRYYRRVADLTQDQLAELAGISAATVSDLERGRYRPTLDTAQAIARVLGRAADEIFMPSVSGDLPDETEGAGAVAGLSEPSEAAVSGMPSMPADATSTPQPVGNRPGISGVSS